MKEPESALVRHGELHVLLPGQRITVQQDARSAPRAPRRLRMAWVVLTVVYLLLAVALSPLVSFLLWTLFALPLAVFSKYRPFPRRRLLRIPLLVAWPLLMLLTLAMVKAYFGNPVAQQWEDQIVLPQGLMVSTALGTVVFPILICICALRARKKPGLRH